MKLLLSVSLILASIIIITATDQYLFCPVYSFAELAPFKGDSIYNPYALARQSDWIKCNFHAHAHCWNGLTYGYGTAADIHRVYNNMQYGVNAVSNYQNIDTASHTASNYIGCYEHGYNILKSHQLVIGTDKVCWKDYLLPQTINNKQNIVFDIKNTDTNAVVVINHPMVRNGYTANNFAYLTQYNCMEVLNPACNSAELWDAALTAGKPVFIIGDDDAHRVLEKGNAGKICTWINVPVVNKNQIIHALKTGSSYAMTIGKSLMQEEIYHDNDSMPMLQSYTASGNAMKVKFTLPAKEIIVSGANGHVIDSIINADSVTYSLGAHESYARVVATYGGGTQLYLNPVFRYHQSPLKQASANINWTQTVFLRTAGVLVLFFWFKMILKIFYPKGNKDGISANSKPAKNGYRSKGNSAKNNEIWYRRMIRNGYRFFTGIILQRKNGLE